LLIKSHKDYISQYDNIVNTYESKCIVEICEEGQIGLTLRPFDALFTRRKLITTNRQIKFMDFYHPNNIYIIEDELLSGIENFMVKSYKQISDEIINKYEIKNWIMKNFTDDSARKLIILNGGGVKTHKYSLEGGLYAA